VREREIGRERERYNALNDSFLAIIGLKARRQGSYAVEIPFEQDRIAIVLLLPLRSYLT